MANISSIVEVQINIQTSRVTNAGFGTILILDECTHIPSITRVATYETPADMLTDGATTATKSYLMAVDMFSQEVSPTSFKVGRKNSNVNAKWNYAFDSVPTSGTYTITVGTATTSAIAFDEVAAGIKSAIESLSGVTEVTVTSNVVGKDFDVEFTGADANTAFDVFSVNVSGLDAGLTVAVTAEAYGSAAEDWDTALTAVRAVDDSFYVLEAGTRDETAIATLADAVETLAKQFHAITSDSAALTTSTSAITQVVKANNYDRTATWYESDSDEYLQSAIDGRCMPVDPGSINWDNKELSSITADNLTKTQITNLESANANYFVSIRGAGATQGGGKVASGEYIDVIRGADYLKYQIESEVWNLLKNTDKLPYDDNGIAALEAVVRSVLQRDGVGNNIIVEGSIVVNTVSRADTSSVDRAARYYDGLTFSADLKGAINKVKIVGTLTT